ncbi:MAG: peptidylprolyl isomerase [Rhodobacteraceae bacterium]|nr:peptidylprolyl isomerase [Paracoccaceae bacterium]
MSKLTQLCLGAVLALGLASPVWAGGTSATVSDGTAPAAPAMDANGKPVTADTVVATVNGTKITVGEMIAMRGQLPAQYQQLPDDVLFKGILDQLIQQTTLEQSVEKNLTKKDTLGLENTKRAFLANVALTSVTDAAVTDAAVQAAYDAKYANVDPGLEYHAAHILVQTEQEAKDIKAKLDAGGDFAALAKDNSKDGSAAQGGDLGWFGVGMMVKPFEDAVVAMKPGQVSDPVQTQFGWHIIKLEETRPAQKPALADVKDDLSKQIEQDAVGAKIKELTDAAKIERTDTGIDPSVLQDATLLGN